MLGAMIIGDYAFQATHTTLISENFYTDHQTSICISDEV
ncbi:MAG: hypothetical protein OFPII_21970 [Osedax symbiont Rs1]|nr:MAG: hypothetical protein OFPII_21970 [Osedax symbiont Rs1]